MIAVTTPIVGIWVYSLDFSGASLRSNDFHCTDAIYRVRTMDSLMPMNYQCQARLYHAISMFLIVGRSIERPIRMKRSTARAFVA
jgi:hypothetical protein